MLNFEDINMNVECTDRSPDLKVESNPMYPGQIFFVNYPENVKF